MASRFWAKQSPLSGYMDRLEIASSQRTLLAVTSTTALMQSGIVAFLFVSSSLCGKKRINPLRHKDTKFFFQRAGKPVLRAPPSAIIHVTTQPCHGKPFLGKAISPLRLHGPSGDCFVAKNAPRRDIHNSVDAERNSCVKRTNRPLKRLRLKITCR